MIDTNNIKCTLEDAWKEFEHSGEISNTGVAEGMIHAVAGLLKENENLLNDLHHTLDSSKELIFFREGTGYYNDAMSCIKELLIKYKKGNVYYD